MSHFCHWWNFNWGGRHAWLSLCSNCGKQKGICKFSARFLAVSNKISMVQKIVLSLSREQGNFRGPKASRPRPRTWGFEAKTKDFKMCPRGRLRGQGRPRGLHLWSLTILYTKFCLLLFHKLAKAHLTMVFSLKAECFGICYNLMKALNRFFCAVYCIRLDGKLRIIIICFCRITKLFSNTQYSLKARVARLSTGQSFTVDESPFGTEITLNTGKVLNVSIAFIIISFASVF